MTAITIRPATLDDREALCTLYHEFHEFHVRGVPDRLLSLGRPPETYEDSDLYEALGRIIEAEDSTILVGESAGQIVGLAEVYVRHDEPNPLRASYLHGDLQSLAVKEGFRRHGVGTELLSAAQEWAKARGATEMRADTWEFEEGPLGFYEKCGYRTVRRNLIRGL
jgi:GNAT superfamily N-acetyltransferase